MRTVLILSALLYCSLASAEEQILLVLQEVPGHIIVVTATSTDWGAVVSTRGFGALNIEEQTRIKGREFHALLEALSDLPESYLFIPPEESNMAEPEFFGISHKINGEMTHYRIERNRSNAEISIVAKLRQYVPKEHLYDYAAN